MGTLPSGPIKTKNPGGGSFGLDWSRITRWDEQVRSAATESGVPAVRILSTVVIESGGDPRAIQVNPSNGNSYGLCQVVPFGVGWAGHHALVRQLSGEASASRNRVVELLYDPATNLRVAASLLASLHRQHGDWDKASSAFFLGNPDWRGQDTVNGNTGAGYKRSLGGLIAEIEAVSGDGGTGADPWRAYPYPAMVDLIVSKPYDGAGFDRVEFRRPLIRGLSTHITDGPQSQTIEFFRDFFGTGGQRQYDALTDLVIGADGRIGLLNDWRDPNRGGTRAGWANGGTDGLEGPGIAFYRRFPRINVHLVSCEHAAKDGQAWTDAEIASSIEIRTAIAQELKTPWDTYPYHPVYEVSVEQAHTFFASKRCPSNPYLNTYEPIILGEVQKKLKAWQGGVVVPPPPPIPVKTYTSYGLTLETVANFFGIMSRHNENGTVDDLPFDPAGPLSLLWLERAEKTGHFPEAESIQLLDSALWDGKEWFATWKGGWVAVLPKGDTRASWRWLNEINGGIA